MTRKLGLYCLCLFVLPACARDRSKEASQSVSPGINDRYATEQGRAATVQILEGQDRDTYQKPDDVVQNMTLKPGNVVCEVGAGTGYFTPYLSKAVGESGKVYAEDPQAEFLDLLKQKIDKQELRNVEIVRGTYTDTNIPDRVCDVTFVLDVYHHLEWPKPMLDAMKADTKPDGRMVVVDWYRRPNPVFDRWKIDAMKHIRLDLDGVVGEIEAHGWDHVETRTFLDHQYFVVFKPR